MNLFYISYKNLINKPLSTILSLLLLTIGVGMISGLLVLNERIQEKFERNIQGIDMVVGAKGSPIQLILSSVYHIDYPTGNIPLSEANELARNPLIKSSIKLGYGDSYKGYRIVGTSHKYPEHYHAKIQQGKLWEKPHQVTLGSTVAQTLNLNLGDVFSGAHGLTEGGHEHDEHHYKVVGIFEPTHSVLDQLILTDIKTVWSVHQHTNHQEKESNKHQHEGKHNDEDEPQHEHESNHKHEDEPQHEHESNHKHEDELQHEHDDDQEITAMFVKFRNPMAMMTLPRMINKETSMQCAMPAIEISRLFRLMGVGVDTLQMIAFVIMIVSGISVFISLFNSLKNRQYELAIMRTLGASRLKLFFLIMTEAFILSCLGFVFGILLGRLGLYFIVESMSGKYHYDFAVWAFLPEEFWLLIITLCIGLTAAFLPAMRAFRMNISHVLARN